MNVLKMMILISIMSMCWWRKNIIPMLLSLELLIMSMFMAMINTTPQTSLYSLLTMLAMMVSGSSIGLSLLVSISSSHNSSNSNIINMITYGKNNNSHFNNIFTKIIN